MTRLTVIIPTADRPELLTRAVESALRQTLPPDQIIVVDNGNEDAVLGVNDNRVIVVRTAPRIGPGRSRNIGAQHALEADYIAFLDDDDIWHAEYLEHSMATVKNDKAVVVVGALMRRSKAGGEDRPYKLFPALPSAQRGIFFSNPGFGGQNILLNRELFLRLGGFDESMPASVDRDLAARILNEGYAIHVQPASIAVLCDHEGGRVRENQVRGNLMFIKKHYKKMTFGELSKSTFIYLRRYARSRVGFLNRGD